MRAWIIALILGLAGTAAAQDAGVADTPSVTTIIITPAEQVERDPLGSVDDLLHALEGGNYRMAVALALGLVMLALGKVRHHVKWFAGDRGGVVLAASLGFMGALSAALASSAPIDFRLFATAAEVTLIAIGGYTAIVRAWKPKVVAIPEDPEDPEDPDKVDTAKLRKATP